MRRAFLLLALAMTGGALSCASDMPLAPAVTKVSGTVLDREGDPVEDARLYFEVVSGSYSYYSATTQADGTYSVEVPTGTYRITVQAPSELGYSTFRVLSFEVPREGARFDHRYTGTMVSGSAFGPGGGPMAQFGVAAEALDRYQWAFVDGRNGKYSVLLEPGPYRFHAEPPSGSGAPRYAIEATVTEQDTVIDLDFSGHEITVGVSLFGSPVPDVEVNASGTDVYASSSTDIDGEARLYLPPGGYDFTVSTNVHGITGPERRYVDVLGPGSVPFDLSGVRWDMTVRRTGDLAPVPRAEAYFYEIGGGRWGSAQTDLDGRLSMVVRPGWGHEIRVVPFGSFTSYVVTGISSSADSTFDVLVPVPAP